jgi:hypothetical protein
VQSQGNAIMKGADRNPRSTGNQGRRPIPATSVRNKPPPRAKATPTVQTASPEPAPDAPRVPIDSVQSVSQPQGSPGASVLRVVSFPFRKAFGFVRKPDRPSDQKRHEAERGDRADGLIRDRANENLGAQQ